MIYPSLDYTMSTPSIEENGRGCLLEAPRIQWYFDHYFLHGEDRHAASPLFGEFSARMPRTLILTAQFCPLRDQSYAYAEKLREAGVEVELHNFTNMIHTFMNLEKLCGDETERAYALIDEFLNRAG